MTKQLYGLLWSALLCWSSTLAAQENRHVVRPNSGPARPLPALEASEPSGGGLMDFIHKLSGPPFLGPGFTIAWDLCRASPPCDASFRFRGSVAYRKSLEDDDAVEPDDADLYMLSIQPALEWLAHRYLELGVGAAAHNFHGAPNSFWHFSFPGYLQIPITPIRGRIGGGVHVFLPFETDDFAPITVDVKRDQTEWVKFIFVSVDFFGRSR